MTRKRHSITLADVYRMLVAAGKIARARKLRREREANDEL